MLISSSASDKGKGGWPCGVLGQVDNRGLVSARVFSEEHTFDELLTRILPQRVQSLHRFGSGRWDTLSWFAPGLVPSAPQKPVNLHGR